jgi:hypothetical protein
LKRPAPWLAILAVAAAIGLIAAEVVWTAPVRGGVRCFTALIAAANTQDLATARRLCTQRYLQSHALRPSVEGGLMGLPRNISKNFQAWRHEREVWICPTNRVGPVYRLVRERSDWRFDGPIGLLLPGGQVEPLDDRDVD